MYEIDKKLRQRQWSWNVKSDINDVFLTLILSTLWPIHNRSFLYVLEKTGVVVV